MEAPFLCPTCDSQHAEPADAHLGHVVVCLECAIYRGDAGDDLDLPGVHPIAA